jgi:prolyl 4-hydroxylase
MALDGSPNPWTEHAGMPVQAGTKYIVTKWYRERIFV